MGVYVFNYAALEEMFDNAEEGESRRDFGKDIIPAMIEQGRNVYAYPYGGYWVDVGTIDAYWEAHMDLLASPPSLNLNDRTWVIHTRSEERPPVRIHRNATIADSLITDGSTVADNATVIRSVLSPGVYVGPGAVVRDSVILNDAYIEAGATVERCIIDKIAVVGAGAYVGSMSDAGGLGITCIGKNTRVPPGFVVGRSVTLGSDLTVEDFEQFENKQIPNGTNIGFSVKRRKPKRPAE
jgi:glucose-1-phosphate adenylyltransferase